MIVITGATGALNGVTLEQLLTRRPAAEVAITVRDPAKAQLWADRGVEVRPGGDYADPARLVDAFSGADQLLLVSSNDPGADAVALHRNAIQAARTAGVGRILYTSHQGAHADSPFNPARVHFATEALLAESGIAWTSLRNGFYQHSLGWLLGPWRETGVIRVPADGPVSWTARADAAEAAARIIESDGRFDGPITLTATAAPTFGELAELAGRVTGRPIGFELIEPEEWVAGQVATGQPEFVARFTLGMYQAAAQGYFAGTDPTLSALLGRTPRTAAEELAEQ